LDAPFQLKYTGMVVVVTLAVASVLGYFAYGFSTDLTESMSLRQAVQMGADADSVDSIRRMAEAQDQKVLLAILGGIVLLGVALGITGIIVTHKVVGPAYKMRLLLGEVAAGRLKLTGHLRKGDELQSLFEAFAHMVESLRAAQTREIDELERALAHARAAG